jgi:hypothetical protein
MKHGDSGTQSDTVSSCGSPDPFSFYPTYTIWIHVPLSKVHWNSGDTSVLFLERKDLPIKRKHFSGCFLQFTKLPVRILKTDWTFGISPGRPHIWRVAFSPACYRLRATGKGKPGLTIVAPHNLSFFIKYIYIFLASQCYHTIDRS